MTKKTHVRKGLVAKQRRQESTVQRAARKREQPLPEIRDVVGFAKSATGDEEEYVIEQLFGGGKST